MRPQVGLGYLEIKIAYNRVWTFGHFGLVCSGFVRRTLKLRTSSAKELDACGVCLASAEGMGEGVWLLPALPGGV